MEEIIKDVTALVGATTMLLTVVAGLLTALIKLWRRDNATDERVRKLWQSNLRRGEVEAFNTGKVERLDVATVVLNPVAAAAYEPVAPFLRQLLREYPRLSEDDALFAEKIEDRFGEWLVKHICGPLGVTNFACLHMALLVAKEPVDDRPKKRDSDQPPKSKGTGQFLTPQKDGLEG